MVLGSFVCVEGLLRIHLSSGVVLAFSPETLLRATAIRTFNIALGFNAMLSSYELDLNQGSLSLDASREDIPPPLWQLQVLVAS